MFTTDHKKHNWQLPGPTQKPEVWLAVGMTEQLASIPSEPYWKMSLIRIFQWSFDCRRKCSLHSPPLNSLTPQTHSCQFQPPIPALLTSTTTCSPPSESFPSHPTPFPVLYSWNILYPIQPNFEVTFSFPESVRLCFYQNKRGLWTQTNPL